MMIVKIMLCIKLHCQQVFKSNVFSQMIQCEAWVNASSHNRPPLEIPAGERLFLNVQALERALVVAGPSVGFGDQTSHPKLISEKSFQTSFLCSQFTHNSNLTTRNGE